MFFLYLYELQAYSFFQKDLVTPCQHPKIHKRMCSKLFYENNFSRKSKM